MFSNTIKFLMFLKKPSVLFLFMPGIFSIVLGLPPHESIFAAIIGTIFLGIIVSFPISFTINIIIWILFYIAGKIQISKIKKSHFGYGYIDSFNESLARVRKGELWGYINHNQEVIVPLIYDYAFPFFEGLATVKVKDTCIVIDKNGKEVISTNYYNHIGRFSSSLASVNLNDKYGYLNANGKEVISIQYDNVEKFFENIAAVKSNGMWGFINKLGEKIVQNKYDDIKPYKTSIDINGDWLIDGDFYNFIGTFPFFGGIAAVKRDNEWGFLSKEGKEIITPQYEEACPFSEGLAAVQSGGVWGFINSKNNVLIPFQYLEAFPFSNGLAKVRDIGTREYGFINKKNVVVISLKYESASSFYNGVAIIKGNFGSKLINYQGKKIYSFHRIHRVGRGFTEFSKNVLGPEMEGYLNEKGEILPKDGMYPQIYGKEGGMYRGSTKNTNKVISVCNYDNVVNFYEGLAKVKLKGKYGFINAIGTKVIRINYSYAEDFFEGRALVSKDGRNFYINRIGENISDPIGGKLRQEIKRFNLHGALVYMLALFAKIVKSDGIYSNQEKEAMGVILKSLNANDSFSFTIQEAESVLKHFHTLNIEFSIIAQQFYDNYKNNEKLIQTTMDLIVVLALSDNNLSSEEKMLINEAISIFGIESEAYNSYQHKQQYRHEQKGDTDDSKNFKKDREYFLSVFGLNESASLEDIKRSYREYVKMYHPDKVAGRGPKIIEVAEEEMKKINEAYEFLRK